MDGPSFHGPRPFEIRRPGGKAQKWIAALTDTTNTDSRCPPTDYNRCGCRFFFGKQLLQMQLAADVAAKEAQIAALNASIEAARQQSVIEQERTAFDLAKLEYAKIRGVLRAFDDAFRVRTGRAPTARDVVKMPKECHDARARRRALLKAFPMLS